MSAETAVYLDASALVKLVAVETESRALRSFLRSRPNRCTSALAYVEVLRAARIRGEVVVPRARHVLRRTDLLDIDTSTLEVASRLDPVRLRSLDAIHLAAAISLGPDLESVITYDQRMQDAARSLGLPVAAPA
jgi:predicted nucleic acid-binding protein